MKTAFRFALIVFVCAGSQLVVAAQSTGGGEDSEQSSQTGAAGQSATSQSGSSGQPGKSASEIAAELANPNTVRGTLTFNFDYISYRGDLPGAGDQNAFRITFQPSLPVPLSEGVNFFARPAVPIVIKQDVPVAGGFDNVGVELGDISFDSGVGKTYKSGLILIGGLIGTLPTATDDRLGLNQLLLGPEGLVAYAAKWGVLGLLVTQQWDVAGEDSYDTSVTGGQYFYTFNLKQGWQIRSGPTYSYNWEAPKGQRWTFPIGFGVNKTSILNGMPWKFGVEYWHYLAQPDAFGPGWQLRLSVSPVIALPWGG